MAKRWENIRDEVAGMLADGQPLEDIISKLEQRKNEMAKAEHIAVFDELKKPKLMTNEEWFCQLSTEEKASFLAQQCSDAVENDNFKMNRGYRGFGLLGEHFEDEIAWELWLKEKHDS